MPAVLAERHRQQPAVTKSHDFDRAAVPPRSVRTSQISPTLAAGPEDSTSSPTDARHLTDDRRRVDLGQAREAEPSARKMLSVQRRGHQRPPRYRRRPAWRAGASRICASMPTSMVPRRAAHAAAARQVRVGHHDRACRSRPLPSLTMASRSSGLQMDDRRDALAQPLDGRRAPSQQERGIGADFAADDALGDRDAPGGPRPVRRVA